MADTLNKTKYDKTVSFVNGFTNAAPVDPNAGRGAASLAKALSSLQPALASYGDNERLEDELEGSQDGKRDALVANALGLKEAVRKGVIQDTDNPWYWKELEEQRGRLAGQTYNMELKEAYAQSEAAGSTEAGSFDIFAREFRANKMQGMGDQTDNYTSSFLDGVMASEAGLASQHAEGVQARVRVEMKENSRTEIMGVLDTGNSIEDVQASIYALRDRKDFIGMSRDDFNQATEDAIIGKALETNSKAYLKMFGQLQSGTGNLGGTARVREAIKKATDSINNIDLADTERTHKLAERTRTTNRRAFTNEVNDALALDADADLTEILKTYPEVEDAQATSVKLRSIFRADDQVEDVNDLAGIYQLFKEDRTSDNVMRMVNSKQIKNPQTLTSLLTIARNLETTDGKLDDRFDKRLARFRSRISKTIGILSSKEGDLINKWELGAMMMVTDPMWAEKTDVEQVQAYNTLGSIILDDGIDEDEPDPDDNTKPSWAGGSN